MDVGKTVLLLGNGGREHAWALSLKKSGASIISWAPKENPGISQISDHVILQEYSKTVNLASYNIWLAIIGPETPLIMGMADWLEEQGIIVFGPNKDNSRLEGSKTYMRKLLADYNIEGNIDFKICKTDEDIFNYLEKNYIVAVKPDGLSGGKGVRVYGDHLKDKGEVEEYAKQLLERDGVVLLEELLSGIEFTLQAFVNGSKVVFLPLVKDYKRAFDKDIGPNTGSMGSCSFPNHKLPYLSDDHLEKAKSIVQHVVHATSLENGSYKGAIYGQFMLTENGPKVVEFNARLGDPEAINGLELLQTPLIDVIEQLLDEDKVPDVEFVHEATVCVYLVPDGYPDEPKSGLVIDFPFQNQEMVRFGSVKEDPKGLLTTKSRSLAIIGCGSNLRDAKKQAYDIIPDVIAGLRYRTDISEEFN